MKSRYSLAGWLVGIGLFFILALVGPEARCRDGWASPSIGRQGACSHHGGVERNSWFGLLSLAISVGAGFFTAAKLEGRGLENEAARQRAALVAPSATASNEEKLAYALAAAMPVSLMYKGHKDFVPHYYLVQPLRYSMERNSVTRKNEPGFRAHCLRTSIERSFVMSRIVQVELHEA